MAQDVPYKYLFNKGDKLVLKLVSGDTFRGDFERAGNDYMELTNVEERYNPNVPNEGLLAFYRKEIENIIRTKKAKPPKPFVDPKLKNQEQQKPLKIPYDDFRSLREMSHNYVYIKGIDSNNRNHQRIMRRLKKTETLGVWPLGMKPTRDTTIGLLAISTWKQVFLFDLVGQKQFYPEIKEIFESENVCKVIHKAGPFADILYRKYNIYIRNIFDTQVVDLIIRKHQTGKCPEEMFNISDCLAYHLNFSTGVVRDARESYEEEDWSGRPLSEEKQLYASQLTTYLITLRDEMKKMLLSKTMNAIDTLLDYHYDVSDFDRRFRMSTTKVHREVKELIPLIQSINLGNDEPEVEHCCPKPVKKKPKKKEGEQNGEKPKRKVNKPNPDYWTMLKPTKTKTAQVNGEVKQKVDSGKHKKGTVNGKISGKTHVKSSRTRRTCV